jgi:septum formation protein
MRETRTVVLASASPRRRELLESLGVDLRVRPSHVAELPVPGLSPRELAGRHARDKAEAARASMRQGEVIVAADTVVDVDGSALGKPHGPDEARAMLRTLSGRDHLVHTAVAVAAADWLDVTTSTTRVWFHILDERKIEEYLATGQPFDKAGAYGIQGPGALLVERIDGDFYTVMGLPLGLLDSLFAARGIALAGSAGLERSA